MTPKFCLILIITGITTKKQTTANTGEHAEKEVPKYTAVGNVHLCSHDKIRVRIPKTKIDK